MTNEDIRILKVAIENSKEHISFCFDLRGIEALNHAIKALEQTRWVPVSEKPQEGRYLCTYEHYDGKCIDFGSFNGEVWYIKPIAYMPLPQPYAESEE